MLFDLRGAGRRTTIKIVYLSLAILMGGGLVLFGIGGDVSGGLVDALTENNGGNTSSDSTFRNRAEQAQREATANPQDPAAWADLAREPGSSSPRPATTSTRTPASSRRAARRSSSRRPRPGSGIWLWIRSRPTTASRASWCRPTARSG